MATRRISTKNAITDRQSTSPALMKREREIRDELHQLKKEEIVLHAAELFYDLGYHETKLDDIAQRMRVGKPYIYNHVKSKAELLAAVARRGTDQVYSVVREEAAGGGNPDDILHRVTRAFTRAALVNHKNVLVYFRENMHLPKQVRDDLNQKRREIDRIIKKVIDDGIESGYFARTDSYINSLTIAGMMSYTFAWYNPGGKLSVDYICDEMARQVLRMVRA